MKAIKIILALIAAVVIIVAVVVTLVFSNINGIVKEAIETIGSDSLQTSVTVKQVDIELTQGKGAIRGLSIANPTGYSANKIITVGDVGLQIDIESLAADVKVIKDIYIEGVELRAEQKNIKDTNIQALVDNIASDSTSTSATKSSDASADVRLMVEKLRVGDSQIQLDTEKFGSRSFTLPGYSQSNLGSKSKGLSPDELGELIINTMLSKAKKTVSAQLESLAKDEVKTKLKEKLEEKVNTDELKEKLEGKLDKDKLKSLFK